MSKYMECAIGTVAAIVMGLGLGYAFSYQPPSYNSEIGLIPDAQAARDAVKECEATTGFGNRDFNYSWRFSFVQGNGGLFRCDIEEKIDYRERSRLRICGTNPQKRYNWDRKLEW